MAVVATWQAGSPDVSAVVANLQQRIVPLRSRLIEPSAAKRLTGWKRKPVLLMLPSRRWAETMAGWAWNSNNDIFFRRVPLQ
jgi:hypothetical protein